jgi:hypothetical protein
MIDPDLKDVFEFLSSVATVLGVPIAIILFYIEKRRERRDRIQRIHEIPNTRYIDYLKLCLDHPELDIFDLKSPSQPSPENKKKEWIAFTILISMMEAAYLLYREHPDKTTNSQWPGWEEYIQWWMSRRNFSSAWGKLSPQFDGEFVNYINCLPRIEPRPEDYTQELWPEPKAGSIPHSQGSGKTQ